MADSKSNNRKQILGARTGESPVDWLSPQEAAMYCSVSTSTYQKYIQDHVLTKKLGKRLLVNIKSLDKYMHGLPSAPRKKKAAARGEPNGGG